MAKPDDVALPDAADVIYAAVCNAVYNATCRRTGPELWDAVCDVHWAIPDVSVIYDVVFHAHVPGFLQLG
jgi:hypothetical protein